MRGHPIYDIPMVQSLAPTLKRGIPRPNFPYFIPKKINKMPTINPAITFTIV